jgi:hypothetical protein
MPIQLLDVALVDVHLRKRGGDLPVAEDAELLALGQQALYLFKLLKLSYQHPIPRRSVSWPSLFIGRSRGYPETSPSANCGEECGP